VELTWWPVAAAGLGGLILAVALAMLVPVTGKQDRQIPLANTVRLTRLPEYRAVVRRQTRVTAVALALLSLLFAATALASARPTGTFWDAETSPPREDIMLCSAAPVTDEANSRFLGYFARAATTYGSERIGLTSLNRRLIPLTRDYQFAAGRLADFARDAPTAPAFSAPVDYDDYSPTVADVLALCLTGFPGFETQSDTRRTLIYLGPGALRASDDTRPSVFTDAQVTDMARTAGAQINAIATPGRTTEALSTVTGATDGQFFRYDSADVDGQLDAIRTAAQAAPQDRAATRQDNPVIVLVAALALSALLGVSLMAARR
jgi:hypothetical protein